MTEREKVMRGLECCCTHIVGMSCGNCPYEIEQREAEGISDCTSALAYDALAMLKEQEYKDRMFHALEDDWKAMLKEQDEEHRRLLSWLGKFCRHIDNGDAWLTDEENIAFFKEKMKQQFGWDID